MNYLSHMENNKILLRQSIRVIKHHADSMRKNHNDYYLLMNKITNDVKKNKAFFEQELPNTLSEMFPNIEMEDLKKFSEIYVIDVIDALLTESEPEKFIEKCDNLHVLTQLNRMNSIRFLVWVTNKDENWFAEDDTIDEEDTVNI